jgi:outer membrane biosynthesis protein TonB
VNERASSAYFSSLLLHGSAIAIILLLAWVSRQSAPDPAQVMELVAGPGSNYMGTEATKLGSETGIELKIPMPAVAPAPAPLATAPEPAAAEAVPLVPADPVPAPPAEVAPPAPKPVAKPTKHAVKLPANPMMKAVTKAEIRKESSIKMHDARVKAAQEKAARAAARAAAAAAASRVSYDEFTHSQGGAAAPKGKAGGVAAGTSLADGAGGKALTALQLDEIAAWKALLRQRWIEGFVPPADFDQKMVANVNFHVSANGAISGIHVSGSTGGPGFEAAVADALRHVTMPAYPTRRGEDFIVPFSLRDEG